MIKTELVLSIDVCIVVTIENRRTWTNVLEGRQTREWLIDPRNVEARAKASYLARGCDYMRAYV